MPFEPSHAYEVVDVFTTNPLEGNPVAIFTAGDQVPESLMQAVARELNLSETVFVLPGGAGFDAHLRIFTPTVELPFAGHPILGAAFVLGAHLAGDVIRLRTAAGIIPISLTREAGGEISFGEMEQPIPAIAPFPASEQLLAALRLGHGGGTMLPIEAYTNGATHVLVALDDAELVSGLAPDQTGLVALGPICVSCFAPLGARVYRTRMFAPAVGVAEDPATGSAAGPIAVHLLRHTRITSGTTIELRQGAEIKRPSTLYATVTGTAEELERVAVGGAAVHVASGTFRLH